MKLFKKALVASAIVSAFGAQAVTVSSDAVKLSSEGVAAGLTATLADGGTAIELDFVVDVLTPAASTITLTFDDKLDLSGLDAEVGANTAIDNVVGSGLGTIDGVAANVVVFNYGTGSFTFDDFDVDSATDANAHTISFEVNLGNPLTASSAFRLTVDNLAGANAAVLSGASQVCYESKDASNNVLETGCATIATEQTQFGFAVTNEYDGKIERIEQKDFNKGYAGSDVNTDVLSFTLFNDESLEASLPTVAADVTLSGEFSTAGVNDNAALFTANVDSIPVPQVVTHDFANDELTFTVVNANTVGTATAPVKGTLSFDSAGTNVIPVTGDIEMEVLFNGVGTNDTAMTDDAGEWELDATVITVPYMPVLFADTSTNVHIANESSADANVLATMIDNVSGERSASVDLGDVPANTVMKFSQTMLADAFGVTEATKLSVTFNIDADPEDINAYATVQNGEGRTEVSNTQSKHDGK